MTFVIHLIKLLFHKLFGPLILTKNCSSCCFLQSLFTYSKGT